MKKKILLFLFVFFCFCPSFCQAAEKIEFKMNEITVNTHEEFVVSLHLEHNPGFGVLSSTIVYDQEKLEFVSSEILGLSNAILKGAEKNLDGNISFFALTVRESKLMEDNGKILTLTFRVKEAVKEDTEIQLIIDNFGKNETSNYDFVVQNGIVHFANKVIVKSDEELKEELPSYVQDKEIVWKSSNEDIAIVDAEGHVIFKKDGDVIITAEANGEIILKKDYSVNSETPVQKLSKLIVSFLSFFSLLTVGIFSYFKFKNKIFTKA